LILRVGVELLKIRVEDIKEKPICLSAEEPVSDYPSLTDLSGSGECEFTAPVKINLTALRECDHIRVVANVSTRVRLHCSRCLEEYERNIDTEFTLFCDKKSGVPLDNETELKEKDLLSIFYEGDFIDFASEIEEQLIMEIPYKPLCREECKGLCGKCGSNLNDGDCGCGPQGTGFKFGVLKNFKVNK
jgi:uncharacterized protein